jgi:HEAT repeat protein
VRSEAGFALANDQAHLSPEQKLRLFAALIAALEDEKPQVRSLAIRVLRIHTGETQGFAALGKPAGRADSVAAWHAWLDAQRAPAVASAIP